MTKEEAIRILASSCIPGSKQTEALETLIPELRESEDERIRKAICHVLNNADYGIIDQTDYTVSEMEAYLEKQKEQKPWKVGANAYFTPEQKPAESISQPTVQGKGVYKICPRCKERMIRDDSMVCSSMPPQYRYECPKCGESECDTVMYDNPEMEEQRPVDYEAELKKCKDNPLYFYDKYVKIKLKSAEWSEKDEDMIQGIIGDLESLKDWIRANDQGWRNNPAFPLINKRIDWLKSLKPSWKPSEEQMKALLNIEGDLRAFQYNDKAKIIAELYEQLKRL